MADDRLIQFVLMLHRKTTEGKIPWEKTDETGVFEKCFPNYSVRIKRTFAWPTDPPDSIEPESYTIEIINQEGEVVDVLDGSVLEQQRTGIVQIMKGIFESARRQALGVEQAITDIMANLEKA